MTDRTTIYEGCDLTEAEVATARKYAREKPSTSYLQRMMQIPYTHASRLMGLLEAEGVMTYADLLYRPLQALEAEPVLRQRVEGFLDHVIVDEYQDINTVQQRLLAVLAGPDASVMAEGDANQCIYERRGARPDTMLENFTATFGTATDYPLSTTFRHGHALALTANHAIMANQRRPDQLCLAAAQNPKTQVRVGQGSRLLLDAFGFRQRHLHEGLHAGKHERERLAREQSAHALDVAGDFGEAVGALPCRPAQARGLEVSHDQRGVPLPRAQPAGLRADVLDAEMPIVAGLKLLADGLLDGVAVWQRVEDEVN